MGGKFIEIILNEKQIKLKQKNKNKEKRLKQIFIAFRSKVK